MHALKTRVMFTCIKPIVAAWLRWRFRLRLADPDGIARMKPPFLVLSNHVNFWDPFLIAIIFRQPVYFLAADGNFRTRLMSTLMTAAGAIPKAKARNDIESIRLLQDHIRSRHVVALFPEGQRTWDGKSRGMLPATPKLARLLRAPVVIAQLRGAYRSTPRWAQNLRRGQLEIALSVAVSRSELGRLGRSEITQRIEARLRFDESRWATEHPAVYTSPRRAERVEQAVFWCPACGAWGSIASGGNTASCGDCGAAFWFAPSGAIRADRRTKLGRVFDMTEWNEAQLSELRAAALAPGGTGAPGDTSTPGDMGAPTAALPYKARRLRFLTGYRSRPLFDRGLVDVVLTGAQLTIMGTPGIDIPVQNIRAVHVQFAHQLEFYVGTRLYVLRSEDHAYSMYRIEQTVLTLQDLYNKTQH